MRVSRSAGVEDDRARSAEYFAAWVAPHRVAMNGFAARLVSAGDAEDIVQEALAVAWRRRDRYDSARGTPRTWLLALTADQINRHRRRGHRTPLPVASVPELVQPAELVDVDLRAAVHALTGRQQMAITAYYYLDLPVEAVATVMGCSPGTVKSTLAAARRRLHTLLQDGDLT